MASLKTLYIGDNSFSNATKEQLKAACKARNIEANKDFFTAL